MTVVGGGGSGRHVLRHGKPPRRPRRRRFLLRLAGHAGGRRPSSGAAVALPATPTRPNSVDLVLRQRMPGPPLQFTAGDTSTVLQLLLFTANSEL